MTKRKLRKTRDFKEFSKKQSQQYIKELLKTKTNIKKKFKPGRILLMKYDAKDKTVMYDKTPLVMVLRVSKGYMLGLNFHWAPMPLRIALVKKIIQMNAKNIKNNVPLEFSYSQIKPFLNKGGYAPIIRLYIRTRIDSTGVAVPDDQLMNIARTKTETFTGGISAEQKYAKARKKK